MVKMEIRQLIVKNRKDGRKIEDIAKIFRISVPTVNRILKRERETGNVNPSYEKSGRKSEMTAEKLEELELLVKTNPDITLEEIRDQMKLSIHKSQISNILRNTLGFRFKKKWYAPANKNVKMSLKNAKNGKKPWQTYCQNTWCFWMNAA